MNLKDRIFELLQDTYGLDMEALSGRLDVPKDEVRRAVSELLAEGRLWETSAGSYRCVLPPPPWLEVVQEALYCEGWPGLSYLTVPEDSCLELYPTPFIREGDEGGGICFMLDWHVELDPLLELFDEQPSVTFGSSGDGTKFSIEGTINGADAWIEIQDRPPDNIPPHLLMTGDGGFRELTEQEQDAYAATYCNRDDDGEEEEPPGIRGLWTPSDN
jgi:hypothetical protein